MMLIANRPPQHRDTQACFHQIKITSDQSTVFVCFFTTRSLFFQMSFCGKVSKRTWRCSIVVNIFGCFLFVHTHTDTHIQLQNSLMKFCREQAFFLSRMLSSLCVTESQQCKRKATTVPQKAVESGRSPKVPSSIQLVWKLTARGPSWLGHRSALAKTERTFSVAWMPKAFQEITSF